MTLTKLAGKTTAIILSVALGAMPNALGYQSPSNAEQQRLETCRHLLESIGGPQRATTLAAQSKEPHETQRVVDLTSADFVVFSSAASRARVEDVLVINERSLADAQFTSALSSSPALFSVAATAGTGNTSSILQSRAGHPEIIVAIPTNAMGVEQVFGVPQSDSAPTVKYLGETSEHFRALKNSHLLNYSLDGRSLAENLISRAKRDTSDPLLVVAHNERGILKLPDGSSIRVDALYQALGKRVGVVLSCDTIHAEQPPTNVLLTNRELDFRDVAIGLASAEHLLSTNPALSLGGLLLAFSKGISAGGSSLAKTVKVVAMIVGGLIVVALLYYWVCEDSDSPPPFCLQRPKSDSKK